jgi:hypothetical protein
MNARAMQRTDPARCGVPIRRIGAMRRSDPALRAIAENAGEKYGLLSACEDDMMAFCHCRLPDVVN